MLSRVELDCLFDLLSEELFCKERLDLFSEEMGVLGEYLNFGLFLNKFCGRWNDFKNGSSGIIEVIGKD